jgi:hypothetical protein
MGQSRILLRWCLCGIAVLAPSLVGCNKPAREHVLPTAAADTSDNRASVDAGEDKPDVGTAPATTEPARELHVGPTVPDDFPKAIPLYPGARVLTAAKSAKAGGRPAWSVVSESRDSTEIVTTYLKTHFRGFALSKEMLLPKASLSTWQSASYDVTMTVGKGANGATTITVSAIER